MKINISIEARMTSTRLPGKVLMPIWGEISVLEFMVKRLQACVRVDNIIIATSTNESDNPVEQLCSKLGILCFRGSEDDVLGRVLGAHEKFETDVIVELTGDCPLIDGKIVDECIEFFLGNKYDYVANCIKRSFPDGMDTQVYPIEVLRVADQKTIDIRLREHVTPYIYQSGEFTLGHVEASKLVNWPDLGLTLDTKEDYEFIRVIIAHFDKIQFSLEEIVTYLRANTQLLNINSNVYRKGLD